MSKIPYINMHYKRALAVHQLEDAEALRMMFCAGVATGIGLGNTIRDDISRLPVDTVEELNNAVVDAMEASGGAPDMVGTLREQVRQDAEQYRRDHPSSLEA